MDMVDEREALRAAGSARQGAGTYVLESVTSR